MMIIIPRLPLTQDELMKESDKARSNPGRSKYFREYPSDPHCKIAGNRTDATERVVLHNYIIALSTVF
jgi:hypothetical protein